MVSPAYKAERSTLASDVPGGAILLKQPAGSDHLRHLGGFRVVGGAVLELDQSQPVLTAESDHILSAAAREHGRLDHFIFDPLLEQRPRWLTAAMTSPESWYHPGNALISLFLPRGVE